MYTANNSYLVFICYVLLQNKWLPNLVVITSHLCCSQFCGWQCEFSWVVLLVSAGQLVSLHSASTRLGSSRVDWLLAQVIGSLGFLDHLSFILQQTSLELFMGGEGSKKVSWSTWPLEACPWYLDKCHFCWLLWGKQVPFMLEGKGNRQQSEAEKLHYKRMWQR